MQYFIQINKETKRVKGYSSIPCCSEKYLEIQIDNSNNAYSELLKNPYIFKYDELSKIFKKDIKFQNKLINEMKNRVSDKEKINALMQSLAAYMIDSIKNKEEKELLMKNQANLMLEIMKLKGSTTNGK